MTILHALACPAANVIVMGMLGERISWDVLKSILPRMWRKLRRAPLVEELGAKEREIEQLKADLAAARAPESLRQGLPFHDNAYWRQTENGRIALCAGCLDNNGKQITLTKMGWGGRCPVCTQDYPWVFGRPESSDSNRRSRVGRSRYSVY